MTDVEFSCYTISAILKRNHMAEKLSYYQAINLDKPSYVTPPPAEVRHSKPDTFQAVSELLAPVMEIFGKIAFFNSRAYVASGRDDYEDSDFKNGLQQLREFYFSNIFPIILKMVDEGHSHIYVWQAMWMLTSYSTTDMRAWLIVKYWILFDCNSLRDQQQPKPTPAPPLAS